MTRPPSIRRLATGAAAALAVLLSAGAIPSLAGQSTGGPTPLALQDYYRVETATDPAISPDGRRVAFVRTTINEAKNRRERSIWLVGTDGGAAPVRLTAEGVSATGPGWSPDGALLAYSAQPLDAEPSAGEGTAGAGRIWFLRPDEPRSPPFQIEGVSSAPWFSPDGQWLAFTREAPPGRPDTPTPERSAEETLIEQRFTGRVYDWMQYRFDGRGYLRDPTDPAATPPEELFVVPRAGGTARQLTRLGVNVVDAAWRPDGRTLVVVGDAVQRDEYVYPRADLWIVEMDGRTTRLTDDEYNYSAPVWSPDGASIVARRQLGLTAVIRAKQAHGAPVDLVRLPVAGGEPVNLTAEWDLLPGAPRWSPEGRLYFDGGVGGSRHLFRVDDRGGPVTQVTAGDRQLSDFSVSRGFDRVAFVTEDGSHPEEVAVAGIDGSGETVLTAVNAAWLRQRLLSVPDRVTYRSRDGTEIEGWVLAPPDYDPARGPYPLVLSIHGGPHGAYGNAFAFQFQLLAARGYLVLYTNPRGSTGYGEKFLWATWGGWGVLDHQDVMAGVDHVVSRYAVDEARMGVTGYSYGGFLTNWVITQTPRFAAAIVGAGISNWISDYGTADIPRTKESEFFGTPWEADSAELLWQLSPIKHARNVRTPTLFVHGESDFRVPIEQGEQMYTALKKQRVPARFVRYPEMSHGNWTPWNTVHRYHHELRWWETWCGAGGRRESPSGR